MKSMVVLFALMSAACGSLVPLAQPPHHPAIVLDAHARPLDTAEVINARALHLQAKALEGHHAPLAYAAPLAHAAPLAYAAPLAHSVVAPAAVSHQSRVDVRTSPAVVSSLSYAASPLLGHGLAGHGLAGHGLVGHGLAGHGLAGIGHYLKKRSLEYLAHSAPAISHQSRVDVISSPAVLSHAISTPVLAHAVSAPLISHAVATPLVAHVAPTVKYVGGSAVSHQSRVDVETSPAVVSHSVLAAPVISTHSTWAAPSYSAHGLGWSGHGHLLKKRSLALAHGWPAAVSHQSRVDVISSPAVVSHSVVAPVAVAHAAPVAIAHLAPAAVSHQSRVDVISSSAHVSPLAHSAVWSAPASHLSHSGVLHSSPLAYASHW